MRWPQVARETVCLVEQYTLPDGRVLKVGAERFMAPEALFNPSILNLEGSGLAAMVFDAIQVRAEVVIDEQIPFPMYSWN